MQEKIQIQKLINSEIFPEISILGWKPTRSILPQGEKEP